MPVLGAVGVTSAHAADDCRQPYGAIQGGSRHDATCEQVGLHLRGPREHRSPSNHVYQVASATSATTTPADLIVTALCRDGFSNSNDRRDTAIAVTTTGAPADLTTLAAVTDSTGRVVGYTATFTTAGNQVIVSCVDDTRPANA